MSNSQNGSDIRKARAAAAERADQRAVEQATTPTTAATEPSSKTPSHSKEN